MRAVLLAAVAAGLLAAPSRPAGAQQRRAGPPAPVVSPDWVADWWNTENGLPQNTVRAIAQTPDGYLWVATFGGLVRFDGARFRVYTAAEHPGLGSDRITALAVGRGGTLWIGTDDGVVRLAGGRFTRWRRPHGLPGALVTGVLEDSRGAVWVSTDRGLCRLRGERCEPFPFAGADTATERYGVLEGPDGTLWLNAGAGVGRIDTLRRAVDLGPGSAPVPDAAFALGTDPAGGLWVRAGSALVRVARGDTATYPLPPALARLPSGQIAPAAEGGFWLRIVGAGVVRFDPAAPDGQRFERLDISVTERPARDATEWSHVVFVDAEGVPWLGSEVYGLARIRPRLFRVLGRDDGLAADNATGVLGLADGGMLVASGCGGLARLDAAGHRVSSPALDAAARRAGCAWSLLEEPDGTLWIGSWGYGLVRARRDEVRHFGLEDGLASPIVLAVHRARDGTLWVGTQGAGVFRMRGDRLERAFDPATGLPSGRVHTIVEDPDGTIWLGTGGGLARVTPDGTLRAWTVADGLPVPNVRAIHRARDGTLWIGTYGGGLARFDGTRFHTVSTASGLAENVVSAIVEDDDGWLWMSGNRGIQRVRRDELRALTEGRVPSVHATAYGANDGLVPNETNGGFQPAAWRSRDGRLWFPTIRGLAVVQPSRARANAVPPRLALEDVVLDGARQPSLAGAELTVPPGTRAVEVGYTGLSSPAPERIEFRYRLLGLGDTSWTYAGARRTAYFSTLPPGRYRFQVSAANRDGVWSARPAELALRVRPTLAQSWWFRAALLLLGAAAAALLVRRRLALARAEHERQRAFTQALLAQQEAERKRIAAELHDSVGQDLLVIKNRAVMGLQAASEGQLAQISEIAGEAIREVRRIAYNLRPYQLDRLGLTAALTAAVRQAAQGSEIRFDVQVDDVDAVLSPEGEIHVFRIVQEAVSNVIRHSGASSAQVRVAREAGRLRVRVEDDGRGLKVKAARATGPWAVPGAGEGGFGLTGIAERVQVLGGTLSIDSPADGGAVLDVSIPASPTHSDDA